MVPGTGFYLHLSLDCGSLLKGVSRSEPGAKRALLVRNWLPPIAAVLHHYTTAHSTAPGTAMLSMYESLPRESAKERLHQLHRKGSDSGVPRRGRRTTNGPPTLADKSAPSFLFITILSSALIGTWFQYPRYHMLVSKIMYTYYILPGTYVELCSIQ